jgi:hypothetical protein
MRAALQQSLPRERLGTVQSQHIPAPVGGWNTRDSLADMNQIEASVLDNWFPRASEVVQRGGSLNYSTGLTGAVKSLFDYTPAGGGAAKLFGVTDAGVYDITAGGAVGAVVQALTNGYVNTVEFTNTAGTTYRMVCNGTDTVKLFDGAVWSTPAITVISSSNKLVYPWLCKHRIFFIEKNSMNAWFLPLDSIQGPVSQFPLGNLFHRGGSLTSGVAWTLDGGEGPDDYCCFITSEGEMAVYKGTDPTSASAWGLVGVYYVGRPLGRKCFVKLGGDVGVLTENGCFPLSKILQTGGINYASAYSNVIQPSWTGAAAAGGVTTEGWDACIYPAWDACIINIMPPASQPVAQQFVMNTVTGKWCSFSGWTPRCFWVFQGQLYFGTAAGIVVKAWDAAQLLVNDNAADIVTTVHTAYSYFGTRSRLKKLSLFRMLLAYSGSVDTQWGVSSDFNSPSLSSLVPRTASTIGSPWDTSPWDTSSWSPDSFRYKIWRSSAHVPGYALSLWLQTAGNNGTLSWAGTDYLLDGGDFL